MTRGPPSRAPWREHDDTAIWPSWPRASRPTAATRSTTAKRPTAATRSSTAVPSRSSSRPTASGSATNRPTTPPGRRSCARAGAAPSPAARSGCSESRASAAVIGLGAGVVWPQLTGDKPETIQASTPHGRRAVERRADHRGSDVEQTRRSSDPTSPTSVPAVPTPTGPVHRAGPAPATIPEGMPLVLVGAATTDQLYAYGQAYDGCASATGDCGLLAWSPGPGVDVGARRRPGRPGHRAAEVRR